jgi:CheY-like chemotaxis protein/two-component sensor histidine kinase
MEAIGQLTGGIAHDFNNLLTSVLGNIELALDRVGNTEVEKLLRGALKSAERGARLTSQLLAFGRRQPLLVRAIDLNALVVGLQDMLAITMTPTIAIYIVLTPELWPALADATQIELALVNLALNARDAMPSGGQLRIETRNLAGADPGRPDDLADGAGDYVAFIVSDTGTGMSEEVKACAFEPFFTTKEIGRGTGLGLSMVYGLAKQLGGTARIASQPGRGTSVAVYVPRAASAVAEPAASALDDLEDGINGEVLLVDDDMDVRELAAAALRRAGFRVIEAESGKAALAIIDRGEQIDVLVTDLVMPGMHGFTLAAEAHRRRPNLSIMLMTGYPGVDRDSSTEENVYPLLRKPFRPADLAAMVLACRQGPISRHISA